MNEALKHILRAVCEIDIALDELKNNGKLFTGWYENLIQTKKSLVQAAKHIRKYEMVDWRDR